MTINRLFLSMSAICAVVGFGIAATPAQACKGATSIFRDDFSDEDPAWGLTDQSQGKISGGAFNATTDAGLTRFYPYQGQNFPGADACVDIVFPSTPSRFSQGGLGFWNGKFWDFVYIQPDGQAGVTGLQDKNWVNPVPARKADSIKTAPGAVNQLRVVWKAPPADNSSVSPDPTVQVFINDKAFIKFKVAPNVDRSISLFIDTEGLSYQFKNLNITQ